MLKEEMDRAAENSRDVRYDPLLIDATYALLLTTHGEPLVIPTLNRDGDCLSDMVLQMFGSIAGAESLLIALDEEENRSEEHTSELQSRQYLVCRLLLEKKNQYRKM